MKASLSIAILALIGKISAVELQNENLLSTEKRHKHKHVHHQRPNHKYIEFVSHPADLSND